MITGVDVASYQGYPDWAQLHALGERFMFTKVTGEGNYVNLAWVSNFDRAYSAGLISGTYDWVEPQLASPDFSPQENGARAARDYWRVLGARGDKALVAVDLETESWDTGPLFKDIQEFMRGYLYTLAALARKEIIVYAGEDFLRRIGADKWPWLALGFHLWYARPGGTVASPWPEAPYPFASVLIHQYDWHGTSKAVAGEYDRNRCQLSFAQLSALATPKGGNDVTEPTPGKYGAYVNANGETIFVWNAGGKTRRVLGIDVRDIGVTVESFTEPDKQESISIQDQKVTLWHESRKEG